MPYYLSFSLLALTLFISGCDFSIRRTDCNYPDEASCSADYLVNNCIWNVDRCQRGFTEFAPKVPESLAKAKMVAVGHGICGIDMNDELTCVPDSSLGLQILPHPTLKFSHVAMSNSLIKDEICATKLDGTSICYSSKGKIRSGPAAITKVVQTIPSAYKSTVCAFNATDVFCESDEKPFEKLGQLLPTVVNQAKTNPADAAEPVPDLVQMGFCAGEFSIKTKQVFALFSTRKMLLANRNDGGALGWQLAKQADGVTNLIFENVKSVSTFNDTLCWIDNDPGVHCIGDKIPKAADTPADIQGATLSSVATSEEHACVIVDGTGELKCFGAQKLMRPIPKGVKGVKQVATSNRLTCYITNEDDLQCFGQDK